MSKNFGHFAVASVALIILSGIIHSQMTEPLTPREPANFNADRVGAPPNGWTATMTGTGKPKWSVESEPDGPFGEKFIMQSGVATYPLLLKEDARIKNGFVETRFKAVGGSEDRAGGIVWRAKDANNYYVVRANALENNVILYKMVEGKRTVLDTTGRAGERRVKIAVSSGQWHSLRVDFAGSRFVVSFNGKFIFEVDDRTFPDAGRIGLWTKADSVTVFDDISYESTP